TDTQHVRFTRALGAAGMWSQISISGATGENRFAYVDFDSAGSAGRNIAATNSVLLLDHCTFTNSSAQYLTLENTSFVIRNCVFPDNNGVEFIHGVDVPANGYAIIQSNLFGSPLTGLNDVIDFSGGQWPNATLQILDNVFTGASDDILDLDGTDALIE